MGDENDEVLTIPKRNLYHTVENDTNTTRRVHTFLVPRRLEFNLIDIDDQKEEMNKTIKNKEEMNKTIKNKEEMKTTIKTKEDINSMMDIPKDEMNIKSDEEMTMIKRKEDIINKLKENINRKSLFVDDVETEPNDGKVAKLFPDSNLEKLQLNRKVEIENGSSVSDEEKKIENQEGVDKILINGEKGRFSNYNFTQNNLFIFIEFSIPSYVNSDQIVVRVTRSCLHVYCVTGTLIAHSPFVFEVDESDWNYKVNDKSINLKLKKKLAKFVWPSVLQSSKDDPGVYIEDRITLYPYSAIEPMELTFDANELIRVIAHDDSGWWTGKLETDGRIGVFPKTYTQSCLSSVNIVKESKLKKSNKDRKRIQSAPRPRQLIFDKVKSSREDKKEKQDENSEEKQEENNFQDEIENIKNVDKKDKYEREKYDKEEKKEKIEKDRKDKNEKEDKKDKHDKEDKKG